MLYVEGRQQQAGGAGGAGGASHPYATLPGSSGSGSVEQGEDRELTLAFGSDVRALCGSFGAIESVQRGRAVGLRLLVPESYIEDGTFEFDPGVGGVVFGSVADGGSFCFGEAFLARCLAIGIGQPICVPSGGGDKPDTARLNYSQFVECGTPHLHIVFVKPRQVTEYRLRFPQLVLCVLPTDDGNVGDARFWVKAFCVEVRRRSSGSSTRAFFERFLMLDDDVTGLLKLDPETTTSPLRSTLWPRASSSLSPASPRSSAVTRTTRRAPRARTPFPPRPRG